MAVMKGQAWNVVETLKEPTHGPLELTRRARLCVWDDLVEIPVVRPMRVPSAELRRRQDAEEVRRDAAAAADQEPDSANASANATDDPKHPRVPAGMDISAARPAPPLALPASTRFDLATSPASPSPPPPSTSANALPAIGETSPFPTPHAAPLPPHLATRPPRSRTRFSYDGPRRDLQQQQQRRRNRSFSTARGDVADHRDDDEREDDDGNEEDDDDGDLGFGGAAQRESQQTVRRVIVERIEMVKTRNPVFTWC